MKNIYNLLLGMIMVSCCIACNNEWEDEQYDQMVSFKAAVNAQGVTTTYVRYNPGGVVKFNLPLIMSGSTMNTSDTEVKIGLDVDTLATLNKEQYGHRQELYFQQLPENYYTMPETVKIPAGECTALLPIEFTLDEDLDQADKWVLPLQIMTGQPGYQANPRKTYRRAMLRLMVFNDYSGTYDASQYKIFIDPDKNTPLTMSSTRAFVSSEDEIFVYAGTRDIDFTDRKLYKIYFKFTDDIVDMQSKRIEIRTDNPNIKLTVPSDFTPSYSMNSEMDVLKPYLKKIYITLNVKYSFVDYTTIPGQEIKYNVEGSLSMQRNLNTLIPDEDQQIQW